MGDGTLHIRKVSALLVSVLFLFLGCNAGKDTETQPQSADQGDVEALSTLIVKRRLPDALKLHQEQGGTGTLWAYHSGELFRELGQFYAELYRYGVPIELEGYDGYEEALHTPVTHFFQAVNRYSYGDRDGARHVLDQMDTAQLPKIFESVNRVWASAVSNQKKANGIEEQVLLDWLRYTGPRPDASVIARYQGGDVSVSINQSIVSRLAPAALGGLYAQAGREVDALSLISNLGDGSPLYESTVALKDKKTGEIKQMPVEFYTSFLWLAIARVYYRNAEKFYARATEGPAEAWQTPFAHYQRGLVLLELDAPDLGDRELQAFLDMTGQSGSFSGNASLAYYRPLGASAQAAARYMAGKVGEAEKIWDDLEAANVARPAVLADQAAWLVRLNASQADVQAAVQKAQGVLIRAQRLYHSMDGFDQAYFFEGAKQFASILYVADRFFDRDRALELGKQTLILLNTVYNATTNYSPENPYKQSRNPYNQFSFLLRLSYAYYEVNQVGFGQQILARLYDWDMQRLRENDSQVEGRDSQFYPILKIYQNARKIGRGSGQNVN